jgi:hypothetical protein
MANDTNLPATRPRTMMIKGLSPNLPERGKIKIGMKGRAIQSQRGREFQPPQKLDHFIVTTIERGPDGNFKRDEAVHKELGDKPKELPVRLLYDDPTLNFPTRYAAFKGRTLWCSGDGETAMRLRPDGKAHESCPCPCGRQEPSYRGDDKCKMNGSLSVLLDGAGGVGGVWKFRTTSYNTIVGLMSSMAFLKGVTGGVLANIPLKLTVRPKQATAPDGAQQTIYVVGLEFAGNISDLQRTGHEIALERAKTHVSIQNIEEEARRMLLGPPTDVPLPGDDPEDIVDEFYPPENGEAPPRPTREDEEKAAGPAQEDAPAEDMPAFELYDETGVLEATFHTAEDYAAALIAAAKHPRRGPAYVKNNAETVEAVLDAIEDKELADELRALYPNLAPPSPPGAGQAADAPNPDQGASAEPPPPDEGNPLEIGLVLRNRKPDWSAFIREVNERLSLIKSTDDLAAFDAANAGTTTDAPVGIRNTYRLAIQRRHGQLTGKAA